MEIFPIMPLSPTFEELTLTAPTQNYTFAGRGAGLALRSQTSGAAFGLELYTKDSDGSDNNVLGIIGIGTGAAVPLEALLIGWETTGGGKYQIQTFSFGAGTAQPLEIFTSGNANQILLNIDGTVSMSGSLTVTGNLDAGSMANTRLVIEESGGGHPKFSSTSGQYDFSDDDFTNVGALACDSLVVDTDTLVVDAVNHIVKITDLTAGINEVLRLAYKNAYNSGARLSWWADAVVETGRIENQLLNRSGAKGDLLFYTYAGSLANTMTLYGEGNLDITGTVRTAADQDWNLGAASAEADFAGDAKIRVTIGGTDYDIVAKAA